MASYSHNSSDLTVVMTADNLPTPNVASASSERTGGTWPAYKAFEHVCVANSDMWTAAQGSTTGWLKFNFGGGYAVAVNYYSISVVTAGGYTNAAPKNWTFEGSNNDTDWVTLDTQTDQTAWADLEMRTFSFVNSTEYQYYRLNISANNGDANWLIVGELELWYVANTQINAPIPITINLPVALIQGNIGDIAATIAVSPSLSGTMDYVPPPQVDGSISISPSVSGTVSYGDTGDGAITLPVIELDGYGLLDIDGVLYLNTPILTLAAEGYDECLGIGYPVIPSLEIAAIGKIDEFGEATLTLPGVALAGEIVVDETGEAVLTLPMLTLSMSAAVGFVGTTAVSIPILSLSATGLLSVEGTGAVTIPALTLLAEIATAAASYQNMVVNIRNNALSIYSNYPFNSFCRFNGVNLGATSTKIYNLVTGTTDNGSAISWSFKTAFLDMEFKTKKKLRLAWLTLKTDGNLTLTVSYPDGTSYDYTATSYETTEDGIRVKFGKGIASRYLALEVKNVSGSTLELDAVRLQLDQYSQKR